jgi:hypothetical protein
VEKGEERDQQDATNLMLIHIYLLEHVSGIIMPIINRTRLCCIWCSALGVMDVTASVALPIMPVVRVSKFAASSTDGAVWHSISRCELRLHCTVGTTHVISGPFDCQT